MKVKSEEEKRKERDADIPFVYEHCSGCIPNNWSWAENNRGFCSGFVKKPSPDEDIIRFCLCDSEGSFVIDVALDEAFEIAAVITSTACDLIKTRK